MPLTFTENLQRSAGLSLRSADRTVGLKVSTNPRTVLASNGIVEATQAEGIAGTIQHRYMSPLRVAQAIAASVTSISDGDKGDIVVSSSGTVWTIDPVTGSGNFVRATSPTLTTPNLGTPSAVTLTNGTGLPVSTGISGLGTNVAAALGVNVGTAGSVVVNGGALGTPSSGTLTNCSGLPVSSGISGLGSNVATFLATPSSANLRSALTDETGTGAAVFADTPTLVTPVLGTPTSGTLTNCTGLPISTGVSGLGANVATLLGTFSSANLASALTDETGSGANVHGTSPTITTPNIVGTTTNNDASAGSVGEYISTHTGNHNANATVTLTIAAPCVVTWTGHGIPVGAVTTALKFTTTGALPTGLTASTTYYAKAIDANTFNVATTVANALAGTFITTTGSQSGVHTGDIRVDCVTATAQDLAAISLGAGDWDVGGQVLAFGSGAITYLAGSVSLTSNTYSRAFGRAQSLQYGGLTLGVNEFTVFSFASIRFSLSGTTTIFMNSSHGFSSGTMQSSGWLRARRVR